METERYFVRTEVRVGATLLANVFTFGSIRIHLFACSSDDELIEGRRNFMQEFHENQDHWDETPFELKGNEDAPRLVEELLDLGGRAEGAAGIPVVMRVLKELLESLGDLPDTYFANVLNRPTHPSLYKQGVIYRGTKGIRFDYTYGKYMYVGFEPLAEAGSLDPTTGKPYIESNY